MREKHWNRFSPDDEVPKSYIQVSEVDRRLLDGVELKNKRLLNVGAGAYGVSEIHFLKRGAYVTALDIEDTSFRILSNRIKHELPEASERFKTVKGSATNMPFASDSFDTVTAFSTIDHIPSKELRESAIREMARVVKKSGKIAVTMPNRLFLPGTILSPVFKKRTKLYEHRYYPGELKKLLKKNGIKILKFDSETIEIIDKTIVDYRLPAILKKFPFLIDILAYPMKILNKSKFLKRFGARMGYLGEKLGGR